ncbi:hypothetical protein [Leucobacter sp. USHLN153]|uniref:hypothetical protein n=1 Tax=Leucobacter sp. USHLN153 TaxID=3081268 RepID=UPI00301607D2
MSTPRTLDEPSESQSDAEAIPPTAAAKAAHAAGIVTAFAREKSAKLAERAEDLAGSSKELAHDAVERLKTKNTDPYEEAIAEYNAAFIAVSDSGLSLLRQRERSVDLLELIEHLISSIAHTPKPLATDVEQIATDRAQFVESEKFAQQDLEAARSSAFGAGVGVTAGAAVASLAPSAALWVATTYGTASSGAAIATLSGAAASNAALAWLGGGALATGGGGIAAGSALLALAGPIGWSLAGATLLASVALFTKKRMETREAKHEALTAVKENVARMRRSGAQIDSLLQRTQTLRESLVASYREAVPMFGADFHTLTVETRRQLGTLVNNAKACAAQLGVRITEDSSVSEFGHE